MRRRRRLLNMMLSATIVFAAVACSDKETVTAPAPSRLVVFYAEGEGTTAGAVTFLSESGGTIQKDVALPMVDTSTGKQGISSDRFKPGATLYMSLQNKQAAGSVTCRIEVDGNVIDEATSSGAYKVVSCTGKVP